MKKLICLNILVVCFFLSNISSAETITPNYLMDSKLYFNIAHEPGVWDRWDNGGEISFEKDFSKLVASALLLQSSNKTTAELAAYFPTMDDKIKLGIIAEDDDGNYHAGGAIRADAVLPHKILLRTVFDVYIIGQNKIGLETIVGKSIGRLYAETGGSFYDQSGKNINECLLKATLGWHIKKLITPAIEAKRTWRNGNSDPDEFSISLGIRYNLQ